MLTPLLQNTPESNDDSGLLIGFDQFIRKLYPYRVLMLILSLIVSSVLLFLQTPFGEYHIHALSQKLAFGKQSPFPTIRDWDTHRRQLAQLEIWIDTVFIFIYGPTLITWCSLFVRQSLFIVDKDGVEFRTPTARFMKRLGIGLTLAVPVGMVADLMENTVMYTWVCIWTDSIPAWLTYGWTILVIAKFLPVVVALWYILLHPLGLFYSLLEVLPGKKNAFANKRDDLQTHAKSQQQDIEQEKQQNPGNPVGSPGPQKRQFWWLLTFWDSLLGVQFLICLLLFMSVIINLDQFDEVFFLWLSSTDSLRTAGTVCCLLVTIVSLSAMLYASSKILLYRKPTRGIYSVSQTAAGNQPVVGGVASALPVNSSEFRFTQTLPLLFVALPFVITLVAFTTSYGDLMPHERDEPLHRIRFILLSSILVVSGFVTVFLFYRHHRPADETDMLLFVSTTPARDYALLIRLIPGSMLFGQGVLVGLLFIFIAPTGLAVAQWIGLHAVLLLWLCAVAYLGTLLIQFNKLPLYPLILGVAVYSLVASRFNDNSTIRQIPGSDSVVTNRPTFDHYFDKWYQARKQLSPTDTTEIPVIIVATEGGGIRAAAWTTACLHQLDNQIPGFSRYVFGISGVSGGGVGAATYIALQRAHALPKDNLPPQVSLQAQWVVSRDLIAPTVASMLFRGGVHNFSPVPIRLLDRNHWLEDAWEKAVTDVWETENDTASATEKALTQRRNAVRQVLGQSFLHYCDSTADSTRFPLLFLNSSVAETGQKAILSPLNLENTPPTSVTQQTKASHFYDVVDLFAVTKADIPFKTATFLCARFPFVTSGGRVEGQLPNMQLTCNPAFHLIDGGYVENTGIMTGVQLIRRLQQITRNPKNAANYKVRYYLLSLRNGQATDNAAAKSTFRFVSEPLTGFLSAAGRQGFALDQLVAYTLKKDTLDRENELQFTYINLALDRSAGHQYPLGWYLSPTAANELNSAAQKEVAARINPTYKPRCELAQLRNDILSRPLAKQGE